MAATTIRFFHPRTELGVLQERVLELKASAHAPPLKRAEQVLEDICGMIFRKHEAAHQVSMGRTAGDEQHQRIWQAKIADLDHQIVDATAALRGVVESCALQRFQRFAAAMVVGAAVLRWLFQPPIDGRPPPMLRGYVEESVFIAPKCAKAGD